MERLKKRSPKVIKTINNGLKNVENKIESSVKKSQVKSLAKKRAKALKKMNKNKQKTVRKMRKSRSEEFNRNNAIKQKQLKRRGKINQKYDKNYEKTQKQLDGLAKKTDDYFKRIDKQMNKVKDKQIQEYIKKHGSYKKGDINFKYPKSAVRKYNKLIKKQQLSAAKKNELVKKKHVLNVSNNKATVLKEKTDLSKKLLQSKKLQTKYWKNMKSYNQEAFKKSRTSGFVDKVKTETLKFNNALKNAGSKIVNKIEQKSPGLKGKALDITQGITGSLKAKKNFHDHMNKLTNIAEQSTNPFRTVLTNTLKDKLTGKAEDKVKEKIDTTTTKKVSK
ncbi:hypothetical protein QTN25_008423 [Entamoeba marina]